VHSVETLIKWGASEIKEISDISHKEAHILLEHATGLSKIEIFTHPEKEVKSEPFQSFIERRKKGEPIEYITNRVSFYGEEFFIKEGALIPRPETELLVDEVIKLIEPLQNPVIVDVGTGSGIVAIMLAKLRPDAKVYGIDISPQALEIAKTNCERFGLTSQIIFQESDLLNDFNIDVDVVVSNPPYIPDGTPLELPLSYEPSNALFGGKLGYEPYEALIAQVSERKIPFLACEMGFDQKEHISTIISNNGHYEVSFYKDYSGLDRGFVATMC
jgi:release factor glutamine methyltransferase